MAYKQYPLDRGGTGTVPKTAANKKKKKTGSSGSAAYQPASPAPVQPEADTAFRLPTTYDPGGDAAYRGTLAALEEISGSAPTYAGTYDGLLSRLQGELENRDPFTYDLNTDPMYLQYRDQYTAMGRMAMEDTMGQAAALTGGYGSTYGQNAGQQAYAGYLQQLNSRVPELYALALDRYDREGEKLSDRFDTVRTLAEREYDAYRDAYRDWLTERNAAQDRADAAYDRGQKAWSEENKQKRQEYDNLVTLISKTGYNPSDAQLNYAGMTRGQADALRNQYLRSLK